MPCRSVAVATADGSRRWLGGRAAVSTTRRSVGLTARDPAAPLAGLTAGGPAAPPAAVAVGGPAAAPAAVAAGQPAVVPFAFAVTFARPGRHCFHCQHPASAGMADTFAVS